MSDNIILASASLIRKKILQDLNIDFTTMKPDFDEDKAKNDIQHLDIYSQTNFLAQNKALSISKLYPNDIVISSDQICELDGKIISKSIDKNSAIRQLKKLNGKKHIQNNAVFIYKNNRVIASHYEIAILQMKRLSDLQITEYVDLDQGWGCAGSYKFEKNGNKIFTKIDGNKNCILGFAIDSMLKLLKKP